MENQSAVCSFLVYPSASSFTCTWSILRSSEMSTEDLRRLLFLRQGEVWELAARKGKMTLLSMCTSGWQDVTVVTEAREVPTHGSLGLEGKGVKVIWNVSNS